MRDYGTGHLIEFDDSLQLQKRSSSLGATEILHRQQGYHKEITVPDFIVSLMQTKVVRIFYRLNIYISEAILVVNDVQHAQLLWRLQ